MKNIISIAIVSLFVLALSGCNFSRQTGETNTTANKPPVAGQNDRTNQKEEPAAEKPIRSTELIEAFKKDKAAANAKYKDKTILISGKITNINDVFGVKALNLRDNENVLGLQTYLADNEDVKKVKVGDEVVVRGKVRGDDTDVVDGAVIIKVN